MSSLVHHLRLAACLPYRLHAPSAPPESISHLVDCGDQAQSRLWQLDWQHLDPRARRVLESGEYLPALACHWLERAIALLDFCNQQQYPAAILEVHKRRLIQLSISDLLAVMGGDGWFAEAQVALVWGFAPDALTHGWHRVLPCRGAMYPCADALNIGWWAEPEDLAKIAVFS